MFISLSNALKSSFPGYFIALLAYLATLTPLSSITSTRRKIIKNSISDAIKNPRLINPSDKNRYKLLLFLFYPFIQYILLSLIYFAFETFYPVELPSEGVYVLIIFRRTVVQIDLYYFLYILLTFLEMEYWIFIIGREYGYVASGIYFALVQAFYFISTHVAIYQVLMNLLYFYTDLAFIKYISKNLFILLIPAVVVFAIFGIKLI